jgi:ABC-2 type transport system ATP-binding protein
VHYDTSAAAAGTAIRKAYATRSTFSEAPTASLFFTGADGLTPKRSAVTKGSQTYTANAPSYSETSGVEGNQVNQPPSDAPGSFVAFTSKPLARAANLVGAPRLTVHLDAPVAAGTQSSDPAGKLVVFAKLYDVAPDGTKTLQHRLISPVRVTDVTKPVHIELPGVVQHFPAGHRIQVVLAAGDMAYAGNAAPQPVTVRTSPGAPSVLRLPLTTGLDVG